jgi:ribose transport system permease protein
MNTSKIREKISRLNLRDKIVYICFLLLLAIFAVILRHTDFLSGTNLMNILRQTAMISVMAVGMTFVISAGEIDLSISSVVALSALVAAKILEVTDSIPLAVAAALGIGLLVGTINGLLTTKIRIPSFLVTLGTQSIVLGIARIFTDLEAVPIVNQTFNDVFGSGSVGPISSLFIWTVVIVAIGHVIYRKTRFGRAVLAVGGNKSAARYSGIRTDRIRILVMIIGAISASFAALLYSGRLHGARYTLGEDDVMNVIAAVVIGGTSFSGGRGTIVGALFGSVIMGILNNGLLLMGLSVSEQMIARGVIIILAVSLSLREKKAE